LHFRSFSLKYGRRISLVRSDPLARAALARSRDIGARSVTADLLLDAVAVLGPAHPRTPALAAEARALLQAAGHRALLDRLDELLARPPVAASSRPHATRPEEGIRA
jgi:hypothetical protein